MEMSGQLLAPATLPPLKNLQYPVAPLTQSECFWRRDKRKTCMLWYLLLYLKYVLCILIYSVQLWNVSSCCTSTTALTVHATSKSASLNVLVSVQKHKCGVYISLSYCVTTAINDYYLLLFPNSFSLILRDGNTAGFRFSVSHGSSSSSHLLHFTPPSVLCLILYFRTVYCPHLIWFRWLLMWQRGK